MQVLIQIQLFFVLFFVLIYHKDALNLQYQAL